MGKEPNWKGNSNKTNIQELSCVDGGLDVTGSGLHPVECAGINGTDSLGVVVDVVLLLLMMI
jgi:hypothetical protein